MKKIPLKAHFQATVPMISAMAQAKPRHRR
jgi:hypothetical protein